MPEIKINQLYKSKDSGKVIKITSRKSGNRHWRMFDGKKSHSIHEGTLLKFYEVVKEGTK